MESYWIKTTFLILLGWIAWWDHRKKEIPTTMLLLLTGIGFLHYGIYRPFSGTMLLVGLAVGGILLVGSILTKGSVGIGDGLFFCASGLLLGGWENMRLLLFSLMLSGGAACVLLVSKNVKAKDEIPFMPFVLVAYLFLLI